MVENFLFCQSQISAQGRQLGRMERAHILYSQRRCVKCPLVVGSKENKEYKLFELLIYLVD
jgi:hypothetical protein